MFDKIAEDIYLATMQKLAYLVKISEDSVSSNTQPVEIDMNPLSGYLTPEVKPIVKEQGELIKQLNPYGDWDNMLEDDVEKLPKEEQDIFRKNRSRFWELNREITDLFADDSKHKNYRKEMMAMEIEKHPEYADNLRQWIRKGFDPDHLDYRRIQKPPTVEEIADEYMYNLQYKPAKKWTDTYHPYSGPILSDNNKSNPMLNADNVTRSQYFNNLAKAMNGEKFFYNITLPDGTTDLVNENGNISYKYKKSPAGLHGLPVNIPEDIISKMTELAGGGSIMPNPYRGKMPRFDPDTDPRMYDSLLKRMGETFPNIGDIKSKEIESYKKRFRRALNNPRNSRWPQSSHNSLLFGKPVPGLTGLSDSITDTGRADFKDRVNIYPKLIADAKKRYRETKHNKYVDKDKFYSVPAEYWGYPASGLLSKLFTPSNAVIGKDGAGITYGFRPEDVMMFRPPSNLGANSTALNNSSKWRKAVNFSRFGKRSNGDDPESRSRL